MKNNEPLKGVCVKTNQFKKFFMLGIFFTLMGCGKDDAPVNAPKTFAYVVNSGNDTISMYSRNINTGALTPLSTPTVPTGTEPVAIAVDATSTHAFVLDGTDNTISMYNIGSNGVLVFAASSATGLSAPSALAIAPAGDFVYVASSNAGGGVTSFAVNSPSTGSIAYVNSAVTGAMAPNSMVINSTGNYIWEPDTTNNHIVKLTVTTASNGYITATTSAGANLTMNGPLSIGYSSSVNSSGYHAVYVAATNSVDAFNEVAPGTLLRYFSYSPVSGYSSYSPVGGVAVSNTGSFGYVASLTNYVSSLGFSSVYTQAFLGTYTAAAGTTPKGVTLDSNGNFAYVPNSGSNTVTIFSVNKGTGYMSYAGTVSGFSTPTAFATAQK